MRKVYLLAAATGGILGLAGCGGWARDVQLTPTADTVTVDNAPNSIPENHALHGRIALEPTIRNMTAPVRMTFINVVSPEEITEAMQMNLRNANMLAEPGAPPKAVLTVSYEMLDLPITIGFSSTATAVFNYELRRVRDGQIVFSRQITTRAEFSSGDATTRLVGTGRAAVMANLASAVKCMDLAAYGQAPADCALSPQGSFSAPIYIPVATKIR